MISSNLLIPILWIFSYVFPMEEATSIEKTITPPPLSLYEQLAETSASLPNKEVFDLALKGWKKLSGELKSQVITIIDFSLPSTEKRLWIIDPQNKMVLLNTVVSHGRNSGNLMASKFSNQPESYQSSLGFYKTAETYQGKHGYSLRLDGLEKGFNDQARNRAIVIHGADYAREEFAKNVGRLGRSLGCPALPTEISSKAIDFIKGGSLLFIYGKDSYYLKSSALIQASVELSAS
ncbi:murein L,D-transpeptidase catalytic domain family protein [Algoriphagus lutimaris]|uniref:murein L,D-transpeptidase catalytic domain family protein n=1 Tax=Algoriphagus lutimaris TaxID=613197 RepID=UPI00196A8660|nr:murein L,D-transpeptidase catalytic domain family protein [Algoriphagus lutimaris]MBN3520006.1 murein L,D-transpeptidase catalytic domain family protein [Algoriphagus lutimaris]